MVCVCREVGTIAYRSGPEWEVRFGHKRRSASEPPDFCQDFEIEHYLHKQARENKLQHIHRSHSHLQGEKFCEAYDPNSMLYISKVTFE